MNLSAPQQFRSKEISKSNVVDDMVESNSVLYAPGEKPDHCVRYIMDSYCTNVQTSIYIIPQYSKVACVRYILWTIIIYIIPQYSKVA